MKNTSLIALTGFTLLLSACGGSSSTIPSTEVAPIVKPTPVAVVPVPVLPLRPNNSPDYYVFGMSGKCFTDQLKLPCFNIVPSSVISLSAKNNYDYLTPRGTLSAVVNAIRTNGYSVGYAGFAASLQDRMNSGSGKSEVQYGFMTFEKLITDAYQKNIKGFSNPAKIVIVAHSHGVVWSHLFAKLHPEIPIEIQVDFDGVCLYWVSDNRGDFINYNYSLGSDWESVCNGPTDVLYGGSILDLQNRVFNNVKYDIEVQSSKYPVNLLPNFHDSIYNVRENGSSDGMFTLYMGESHSGVTEIGSLGLNFAIQKVLELAHPK